MTTLRSLKIVLLWVCLMGFPIVAFWMGWLLRDATNRGKALVSQGRIDQLEVALQTYHADHGTFPPTQYQPKPGGPIHSWRVLLIPQTSGDLVAYPKYDFSQEWNSPNNLQALGRMAPRFLRVNTVGENTQYLAIGDDGKWPSKKPLRSRLITQGKDRFLLVEHPGSEIHWMEPKY